MMNMRKRLPVALTFLMLLICGLFSPTEASAVSAAFPSMATTGSASASTDSVVAGKYIYVPDSLQNDVLRLLAGNSKVVDDDSKFDSSELVVWKGDTIPMKLRTRNFGRYDRGLFNYLFIPRGRWGFGLTASYGELSTDDLEIFDLLSDIDIGAHIFSIKPYLEYTIRNNISVGMRFGYTSGKASVGSLKVDIDEDMNFNLHDIMYRSESYSAAVFFRQYVGLARRSRFGIFNEIELSFSSGNSDFTRPYGGVLRNTHTTYNNIGLNFSPGVSVFMMKNAAFNLSFGVFGFSLKNEHQYEEGVSVGNRTTSGANFRFNLFNLNFGIALHI